MATPIITDADLQATSPLAILSDWQRITYVVLFALAALLVFPYAGQDFGIYRSAAQSILANSDPYFPYDIGTSFIYHPFILLSVLPFAYLPASVGYGIWTLLSIGAYVLSLRLMIPEWQRWHLLLLAFIPMIDTLFLGQINSIILLLLVVTYWCWQHDRDYLAGIVLGFAILIKLTPIILIGFFIITRRWRIALVSILTLIILTIIPVLIFGFPTLASYIDVIRATTGNYYPILFNVSPQALFIYVLPQLASLIAFVFRATFVVLLGVACYLTWKVPNTYHALAFALFVVLFTVFSPLQWLHHLVLLPLPLLILLRYPQQEKMFLTSLMMVQAIRLIFYASFFIAGILPDGFVNIIIWTDVFVMEALLIANFIRLLWQGQKFE